MGNWHCVPSSCGEVVYQEYEPPKIRYRYPGESWQEIVDADDYNLEQKKGQCYNKAYQAWGTFISTSSRRSQTPCGAKANWVVNDIPGKIISWEIIFPAPSIGLHVTLKTTSESASGQITTKNSSIVPYQLTCTSNYIVAGKDIEFLEFREQSSTVQGTDCDFLCIFTVTKNGQTVYTETRSVCPEVEKIPCKLSTTKKSIKIEKLPYLEKIEVVPYQYSAYRFPGIPAPIVQTDKIPTECLNIYNNAIFVIPPTGEGIYPNATPFDSLVTQICSYPGCPSPEYQVICDCGESCKSCPPNTCAVECDGHICCYDDSGISVESIALSDYCGGGS